MKKVRVNVTVDWTKSVIDATKPKEIKEGIIDELTDVVNDAFGEMNPSDIKIRFLREAKKRK
jgi:phenylpyruvate tautomerase PptA (4-oxalocrotonate tautomerase family)